MRFSCIIALAATLTFPSLTLSAPRPQSFISPTAIQPSQIAKALTSLYPNPSIALLAPPYWWWESGSTIDALLTYMHTTGDSQYNALLSNTLVSQVTGTNDFMTPDATGNDDQAWWGLAAMSAAEYGLPAASGALPWIEYARNVFNTQKARWNTERCNGGLKWKINPNDPNGGYNYRSTISNGLFFQLAARLARFTGDQEARTWAEKSYDWVAGVGLIDGDFNVYDGTDDAKGTGCVDVNHNMWSYNTATFLYGSAVMSSLAGADAKWADRTKGFLAAAQRNFVKDGRLFETICEGAGNCNTDQVSFKGVLARWMGATAVLMSDLRGGVADTMGGAANAVTTGWNGGMNAMEQFTTLEIVDALIGAGGGVGLPGKGAGVAKREVMRRGRNVAGRIHLE